MDYYRVNGGAIKTRFLYHAFYQLSIIIFTSASNTPDFFDFLKISLKYSFSIFKFLLLSRLYADYIFFYNYFL